MCVSIVYFARDLIGYFDDVRVVDLLGYFGAID